MTEKEEKEKYDYAGFWLWYKFLIRKCGNCFERDIVRDNKENLWQSWIKSCKGEIQ